MRAIGILGGVFDPLHWGHLWVARRLGRELGLAEVRLLPALRPPHKPPPAASARCRSAALWLVARGDSLLRVDDRELRGPSPSYTTDSVRALRIELGPHRPLCLLLGADAFAGFTGWRDWPGILECVHLAVAGRLGAEPVVPDVELVARATHDPARLRCAPAGAVYLARYTGPVISSGAVRAQLAAGRSARELVPAPLLEHFHKHASYHAAPGR